MKFYLTGDILHPGIIEVEADTLDDAINKAECGEFAIWEEQDNYLAFDWAGQAEDADGHELVGEAVPVI